MCLCTSVFASTHAHVFACKGQKSSLGFSLCHSVPHCVRLGLSLKLELSSFASLADQKGLEIPLSQLPSGLELPALMLLLAVCTGAGCPKSGGAGTVTTLPAEPRPQAPVLGGLFISLLGWFCPFLSLLLGSL